VLRDKIACSQFISGLADNFVKKTLRLEGINSLKTAVVRARAIKEEEYYDRGRGNLNFARRNFLEKKNQENKKVEGEKEDEKGGREFKNVLHKNKTTDSGRKEYWLCGRQGHSVLNAPAERETRIS